MSSISSLDARISGIDFGSRQGYAVAKLTMDQAKTEGEAAVDLVKAAAEVGKRAVSDPSGPSGRSLDAYA